MYRGNEEPRFSIGQQVVVKRTRMLVTILSVRRYLPRGPDDSCYEYKVRIGLFFVEGIFYEFELLSQDDFIKYNPKVDIRICASSTDELTHLMNEERKKIIEECSPEIDWSKVLPNP